MNERIKYLISTAEIFANKTVPQLRGNETYWWRVRDEKFAELLIKECANIDFRKKAFLSQDDDASVAKTILEHFGVE